MVDLAILAGLYPIFCAWQANRRTSLRDAMLWTTAAWISWAGPMSLFGTRASLFIALSLTGCASVAVLGARRPHVLAWNFVVFGLFGVLALPLVEGWLIG